MTEQLLIKNASQDCDPPLGKNGPEGCGHEGRKKFYENQSILIEDGKSRPSARTLNWEKQVPAEKQLNAKARRYCRALWIPIPIWYLEATGRMNSYGG